MELAGSLIVSGVAIISMIEMHSETEHHINHFSMVWDNILMAYNRNAS